MLSLKWSFFLLLCLIILKVNGQQNVIYGVVKSKDDMPIVGAKISLLGSSKITFSDQKGHYSLLDIQAGEYLLEAKNIGYITRTHTVQITGGSKYELDFVLEEQNNSIELVNVEGKTKAMQIKESGFNVNVIETKQYANTNSDINQILNRSTGVHIREQGGLGSDYTLSVNGLSGNHIKFFIDGIPMEAYGGGMTFNNIPVNIIERIEVYKGAIPGHLTSDALGGAINIITKRDQRKSLDISYGISSFNTHRAAASLSYAAPKSGLQINLNSYFNSSDNSYLMRNDPRAKVLLEVTSEDKKSFHIVESARRFHDGYRSGMVQLEAGLTNKQWADLFVLGLTYNDVFNEIQTGATQEKIFAHLNEKSNSIVPNLRYRKDKLFIDGLSATLFANYANSTSVITDTAGVRGVRWNQIPDTIFPNMGELSAEKSIQHFSGYNGLIQGALNYKISSVQSINTTYMFNSDYRKGYNEYDPYNHSKEETNIVNKHVLGLNYLFAFFDKKWKNTAFGKYYSFGGNIDTPTGGSNRQSKNYFGYGLASSYFVLKDFGFKISYEHAYRLPTLTELFGNGNTIAGNLKLVPEKSDNYNLGTFYTSPLFNGHQVGITANLFYRNAKDYIHSTPALENGNGGTFRSSYNFGGIKVSGAEFEAVYSYANLLRFTANVSYESAVDREKYVEGTNRVRITYGNRLPDKPWLYGNTDFVIGKDAVLGKGTRIDFNWFMQFVNEYSYNWSKLGDKSTNFYIPAQWIQNVGLIYSLKEGMYNIALESRNLFDVIAYDNGKLQKPGRSISLKLRYNLNIK